jgi:hypothetical protein
MIVTLSCAKPMSHSFRNKNCVELHDVRSDWITKVWFLLNTTYRGSKLLFAWHLSWRSCEYVMYSYFTAGYRHQTREAQRGCIGLVWVCSDSYTACCLSNRTASTLKSSFEAPRSKRSRCFYRACFSLRLSKQNSDTFETSYLTSCSRWKMWSISQLRWVILRRRAECRPGIILQRMWKSRLGTCSSHCLNVRLRPALLYETRANCVTTVPYALPWIWFKSAWYGTAP